MVCSCLKDYMEGNRRKRREFHEEREKANIEVMLFSGEPESRQAAANFTAGGYSKQEAGRGPASSGVVNATPPLSP